MRWLLAGAVLGFPVGVACLAFCGPVAASSMLVAGDRGARSGARSLASFLAGRLAGYVFFGAAVGALGSAASWDPDRPLALLTRVLLSVALIASGFAVGRGGWFERHVCPARGAGTGRLARLPLLLGLLSGFNICPPFLLAANEVLRAGGWLPGAVFFSGFFLGTSVWLVPLALVPLAWFHVERDGLVRLARASAVIVGAAFLLQTVALLRPVAPVAPGGEELADPVREMFPGAASIRYYDGPPRYEVSARPGGISPDAFVAVSAAEGFGGPVRVLTALDRRGGISAVRILPNQETPSYIGRVDTPEVLGHFTGRSYADDLSIRDLDAVSGATMSADAVGEAVRKGARLVAVEVIGLPPPGQSARPGFPLSALDVMAVIYVLVVAVLFRRPRPAWQGTVAAAASVVVLGIFTRSFISVADWARMLAGAWPGGSAAAGWYLFVGAVAALTFFRGRIYFRHLCPFGSLGLLLSRIGIGRLVPSGGVFRALRAVRWLLLGLTMLGFAYTAETAAFGYEPFGPASDLMSLPVRGGFAELVASRPMALALVAFVLAVSLFVPRFWCRFLCPAGAGLDVVAGAWPGRPRGRTTPALTPAPLQASEDEKPGPERAHGTPQRSRRAADTLCVAATAGVLVLAVLAVRESASSSPAAGGRAGAEASGEGAARRDEPFRPKVEPITLERVREAGLSEREAMYYEKLPGGDVQCTLCPAGCLLRPGERGQCRVRANFDGTLRTLVYGKAVSRAIDPIEKKPLLHFLPGTKILSVATAGCVLRCRFCQNWQISQAYPEDAPHMDWSPEQIVADALKYRCPSIAFTYTEPSVFYEYMLETSRLAEEKGILTVWVTCGYLNEEPLVELCRYLDGANVDLKGFSEEYYREYCGARLQPVLDTLKVLRREKVYFEVTNLIVPGGNDDPKMIEKMCEWIRDELGAETVLHFSRYSPHYQMKRPGPTPIKTLLGAREIALKAGLKYVYIGNVRAEGGETTRCPKCGEELIRRWGYVLERNIVKGGACPKCGMKLPGVWPEDAARESRRDRDAK